MRKGSCDVSAAVRRLFDTITNTTGKVRNSIVQRKRKSSISIMPSVAFSGQTLPLRNFMLVNVLGAFKNYILHWIQHDYRNNERLGKFKLQAWQWMYYLARRRHMAIPGKFREIFKITLRNLITETSYVAKTAMNPVIQVLISQSHTSWQNSKLYYVQLSPSCQPHPFWKFPAIWQLWKYRIERL